MENNFIFLLVINFGAICFIGYQIGIIKAQLQYIRNKIEGDEE